MVAPTALLTVLYTDPPITFGLLEMVLGSSRNARLPLTLKSSGWLSVVPRKFAAGVVPALPLAFQKVVPNVVAFTSAATMDPSAIFALLTAPSESAAVATLAGARLA